MQYLAKNWAKNDFYNFSEEWNRIESFNEYCYKWLNEYYKVLDETMINKTNWQYTDIPDLNDYNRIKSNMNALQKIFLSIKPFTTRNVVNESFDFNKANALEQVLKENMLVLGNWQFSYEITGLSVCGNNDRIGGE